uniref:Rad50/SbcC-type AAA domain-containing protein n=1 Tax=Cuerna arida TaxID=1464854 RepID=A0A1B6G830_9HEMI
MMDSAYFSQSQQKSSHSSVDYGPAGTIVKVQMKNFMCHDNLEVKLNSRINFICGKNGSGKSAIQTAIAVGLGGKALATNRGTSMKDLIKSEKSSCTIIVVLSNQGPVAYKPREYGPLIQVERGFSQTSSLGYKIKNSAGKIVSTKKSELDKIVAQFNIQTENPVCILHQDVARNFLNSSDPKNKFMFYLKASRFDEINCIYCENKLRIHAITESIERKFEGLKEIFSDVIEMKKKLKTLEDAKEKERLRDNLENELLWALINEDKVKAEELRKKKEIETLAKNKAEKRLKEGDESNLKDKLRELEDRIKEMDNMVKDARDKVKSAREDFTKKKESWNNYIRELTDTKQSVRLAKRKYDSCLAEIENLTKNAPEIKQRQENLKRQITEYEQKLVSIKAAETSFEHDRQQLKDTVEQVTGSLEAVTSRWENIQRQKRKREENLKLLSQNASSLSVYGEGIVNIVDEINKAAARRKFEKKPIGPLGLHIKVKDSVWSGAVENFLGKSTLTSFCVDNNRDASVLSRIFKSVCDRYKIPQPSIFCSKFLSNVHNIRQSETGNHKYMSLSGALEIDNSVVANCLIDQQEIETVLLIPTNAEAYNLLDEPHKVPRNCNKAFTLTGDLFFPAPNYKSYSNSRPVTHATLLQAKQEDLVRNLKSEIIKFSQELNSVSAERHGIQEQIKSTTNLLKNNEEELRNLKKQRFAVERKIKDMESSIEQERDESNVAYLVQESKLLQAQLEKENENFERLKNVGEELKANAEHAKNKYERLQNTIAESDQEKAPIQGEIERLKSVIQQASLRSNHIRAKIKEYEENLNKLETELTELTDKIDDDTENASQICEPVRVRRETAEIRRELNKVKMYLQRLEEENGGSLQVLERNFKERHDQFNRINYELGELKSLLKKTKDALVKRRLKEQQLQMSISTSARHNFHLYLAERNFDGWLKFDFNEKTLNIIVRHQSETNLAVQTNTSSLSGGEKSFSTVAFIMAMWHQVKLPFHFLDEFDVFMDGINRRVVMDLLIDHAKETKQQFVFLTPLDMSSISSSDIITIHRLEAPRD